MPGKVAAYREVFAAFPGQRVLVRTLDAGSDKPLPFANDDDEDNPALGVRGLRLSRRRPALLDDQLRALARAADAESAEVEVMAPMVATVDEAADFALASMAIGRALAQAGDDVLACARADLVSLFGQRHVPGQGVMMANKVWLLSATA